MGIEEERDRLLAQANHEDDVLQAYRSLALTVQSILLAGGAALVAAEFQVLDRPHRWILLVAVLLIGGFSLYGLSNIETLLSFKAGEVSHFQRQVLYRELQLPAAQQVFLPYKRFQWVRGGNDPADFKLATQADVDAFIPVQGRPHANSKRAAIHGLIRTLEVAWVVLLVAGICGVVPESLITHVIKAAFG